MLKKVLRLLVVTIGLSFLVTNTTTAQIEQGQSLPSAELDIESPYTSGSGFNTNLNSKCRINKLNYFLFELGKKYKHSRSYGSIF